MCQPCRQAGFSLIEVLVAAAIMIMSMGLILQLFGSGIDRMHRVGRHAKQIIVEKEIYSRLSTVNPAELTNGRGVVGDWSYDWTSGQIEPYQHISPVLGEAPYPRYVALYRLTVAMLGPEQESYELDIYRIGWREQP